MIKQKAGHRVNADQISGCFFAPRRLVVVVVVMVVFAVVFVVVELVIISLLK